MRFVWIVLACGCGSSMIVADDVAPDSGKKDGAAGDATTQGDAGDASTTDSPGDASTMDGSGGIDAGPGTYSAHGIIGGLDRVRIVKVVGNTCFAIQLVSPSNMKGGLTLPSNWGFEAGRAMQPAAACDPNYMGPVTDIYDATSQNGTIQFNGNGIPQTITSVMATVFFANNPSWCPPSETFSATNVPVQ